MKVNDLHLRVIDGEYCTPRDAVAFVQQAVDSVKDSIDISACLRAGVSAELQLSEHSETTGLNKRSYNCDYIDTVQVLLFHVTIQHVV